MGVMPAQTQGSPSLRTCPRWRRPRHSSRRARRALSARGRPWRARTTARLARASPRSSARSLCPTTPPRSISACRCRPPECIYLANSAPRVGSCSSSCPITPHLPVRAGMYFRQDSWMYLCSKCLHPEYGAPAVPVKVGPSFVPCMGSTRRSGDEVQRQP